MYYKENGKKVPTEYFKEDFGYGYDTKSDGKDGGDDKGKKWMWWLLGALFVIAIILVIIWIVKKNKSSSGPKSSIGYKFY